MATAMVARIADTEGNARRDQAAQRVEELRPVLNQIQPDATSQKKAMGMLFGALVGNDNAVEVPVEPEVPDGASAQISTDIGTVQVPVELVVTNPGALRPSVGGGSGVGSVKMMRYANGLPYVPYDNYLALLHKGEQVVPARATGNNFSSNLYVDRMIMNNGQDAQGLAGAVAAANRRVMRGRGS